MIKEIIDFLDLDWKRYKEVFVESIASQIPLLDSINNYLIENAGKQLRPMLCLLAARACAGKCTNLSINCATAAEMLHTASLLHDDVVDKAGFRHGKPTVSSIVSATGSVLIGDYWLSKAIYHLVESDQMSIMRVYRNCFEELSKGEVFQMQKAISMDTTEEEYYRIIGYKTASLFHASMMAGAYSVDATQEQLDAISEYAHHLGIAYQIRDDILDYSPNLNIGKPVGQDIEERKITLPLFGAMKNLDTKELAKIKKKLRRGRKRYLLNFVLDNGGLQYAQEALEAEAQKALDALKNIADSQAKSFLIRLATTLCVRKS